MKDRIELVSGGEEYNYLRRLKRTNGQESTTYLLKTSSYLIKSGQAENGKQFIYPPGGPKIVVGAYLKQAEAVVRFIDHVMGTGYIVTFEPPPEKDKELLKAIVEL